MRFFLKITLILMLFNNYHLKGQENYNVPDFALNGIYNIIEDHNGFIWLSTFRGLKRFDGERIRAIELTENINDEFVKIIYVEKTNELICINYQGEIIKFSVDSTYTQKIKYNLVSKARHSGFYLTLAVNADTVIFQSMIKTGSALVTLANNNVTEENLQKQFFKLLQKKNGLVYSFENFKYIVKETKTGPDTLYTFKNNNFFFPRVSELQKSNELFFYDDGAVMSLDFTTAKIVKVCSLSEIAKPDINDIVKDANGNTWIFTKKGAFLMKPGKQPQILMKDQDINSGFESRDKRYYWFSSSAKGLYKLPTKNTFKVLTIDFKARFISYRNNNLYIVGNNDRLYIYNSSGAQEVFDFTGTKVEGRAIKNIIADNNSLIVEARDCFLILEKTPFNYGLPSRAAKKTGNYYVIDEDIAIKDLVKCKTNLYYIGLSDGLFILFKTGNTYLIDKVDGIEGVPRNLYLKDNLLYFSINKKVLQYNIVTKKIKKEAEFDNEIKAMAVMPDELLAGFNNKGLSFFTGNKYNAYNSKSSELLSDEIIDINYCDKKIWINTTAGLQELNLNDKTAGFYKPEFLKGKEFQITFSDSMIYALNKTFNAVVVFKNYIQHAGSPPKLYIDLVQNNGIQKKDGSVVLPYLKNSLSIKLGELNFDNQRILYYYQLISGRDSSEFILCDGNISFNAIESGNYKLRFYCKNSNSQNSNTISYSFEVEKPFWDKNWFKAAITVFIALVITLFVGFYYKRKQNLQKERHENEYKILQLEQQLFKSLMNPHFIFNSLNAIQSLINNNRQKEASANISLFSQLVRKNLEDSVEGFCTFAEELDRLKLYVEIENLRFNNCIDMVIELELNHDAKSFKMPSFILQPLVENSILHGLLPKGGGNILVSVKMTEEKQIQISIRDNGVGLNYSISKKSMSEKKSLALGLVSSRLNKLQKIEGKKYSFDIIDRQEYEGITGTICIIDLPVM